MRSLNLPLPALSLMVLVAMSASCVTMESPHQETYYDTEYISENRSEPFTEVVPVREVITGEDILVPYISWSNASLSFKGIKHIWYYGFDLSDLPGHENEKIKISLGKQQFYEYTTISIFDMSPRGQLLQPPLISHEDKLAPSDIKREMIAMQGDTGTYNNWLNLANLKLNFAMFIGGRSDIWLNYEGPYTVEFSTKGAGNIAVIICGPTVPQNMRLNVTRTWTDNNVKYITVSGEHAVPYQLEKKVAKQRTVIQSRQAPFWELYFAK